jgi:hypothetical protein
MMRHQDATGKHSAPHAGASLVFKGVTSLPEGRQSQRTTHCAFCGKVLGPGRASKRYCNSQHRLAASKQRWLIAIATQAVAQLWGEAIAALPPERRTPDLFACADRVLSRLPERLATIFAPRGIPL